MIDLKLKYCLAFVLFLASGLAAFSQSYRGVNGTVSQTGSRPQNYTYSVTFTTAVPGSGSQSVVEMEYVDPNTPVSKTVYLINPGSNLSNSRDRIYALLNTTTHKKASLEIDQINGRLILDCDPVTTGYGFTKHIVWKLK